jgi:Cu(I)/Ag(I) efflux system protein CusF
VNRFVALSAALALATAAAFSAGAQPLERQTHKGTGVVKDIDRAGAQVTLRHDPIRSLKWPTMTMVFAVKDKAMLETLSLEKKVEFEFVLQGQQFVITSIR